MGYVCFIIDAFSRRIVGWRTANHMRTQMVLDALEMARWSRGTHPPKLSTNTYALFNKPVLRPPIESGQYTSIRYGERLAEIGAIPSIGSIGDSYDNALAETVNSLYKQS
jgi:putative transposase